MTRPLFSSSWYRVAELRPRLRSHADVHRHRFRGEIWYVLADRTTGRFHRFSPTAYLVIGLMDGTRTMQTVWETASERLGDDAPTQDEVIQLLAQLHAADALLCDTPPDAAELLERHHRAERQRWRSRLLSVFSWRFRLVDPERFLQTARPAVAPFWSWWGGLVWLAVVAPAAVLLAVHWTDFSHGVLDRLLTPQSLGMMWLLFPLIKTLHELGHATATKAFGGEVHDLGVMLLVVTPVPYVDASAAWAFPGKWRRIAVGAAGMAVELVLASLALYVWLAVEPGLVRALAFHVIVIAGISTLVFNANPLLRYDGYYILADLLEIPNLRARANRYLGYLGERYLLGRREAEPPTASGGERVWFVAFAVASFTYRVLVLAAILLYLAEWSLLLAVIFGGLGLVGWIVVPVVKGIGYLTTSPHLRAVRSRAIGIVTASVLLAVMLVGGLPVPFRSLATGVIWVPDEAVVRAGADGFVDRILARPGARVRPGQSLLVLRDPALDARVQELAARRRELMARYDEQRPVDYVRAEMLREDLAYVTEQLADARRRVEELTVRSGAAGTFVVPSPEDLPERFLKKGELIGYAVELGTVTVRTVLPQDVSDIVRHQTQRVDVRLVERLDESVPAVVRREVPTASERLPAPALGSEAGGPIVVDPRDTKGVTAVERVFQVDVELPASSRYLNVGGRAHVRFDHGRSPLAVQWYQKLRHLFLSRLNV